MSDSSAIEQNAQNYEKVRYAIDHLQEFLHDPHPDRDEWWIHVDLEFLQFEQVWSEWVNSIDVPEKLTIDPAPSRRLISANPRRNDDE